MTNATKVPASGAVDAGYRAGHEGKAGDPIAHKERLVEGQEISFFSDYYESQAYNPAGWHLRLCRELRTLHKFAGVDSFGNVLSLGCGDGLLEVELARSATHVTGVDISPDAIQLARRHASSHGVDNVDFLCQSTSEIDWSKKYDVILCVSFLHHVPADDLADLLANVYGSLKDGGSFYCIDPNAKGVLRYIGRLIMGDRYESYHSINERELYPEAMSTALQRAGFSSVRIGYNDLTLIPALFLFPASPAWTMRFFAAIDAIWCRSPFAPWSSAFCCFASRRRVPS